MKKTLDENPENFGLYNNGITIVVNDFEIENDVVSITEPFIVNGCQTTRTIWEVFDKKINSGATGKNDVLEKWKQRAEKGVVVIKIAKVGNNGELLLQDITRFTNSQNAVKEKDFIALVDDFKIWKEQLSNEYDIYLEIQRGGWDSQKVFQRENPTTKYYKKYAVASDLLKIYGAGWLKEAGTAYGKNAPFLPNGTVFNKIINADESNQFSVIDLYAAYLLQEETNSLKFGRAAEKQSRKQSRYLFYYVVLELLRDFLHKEEKGSSHKELSEFLIKFLSNEESKDILLNNALEVIDAYLTQNTDDNVFTEWVLINDYNSDLNAFLKSEKLGKNPDFAPNLKTQLISGKKMLSRDLNKNAELKINLML